MSRVKDYLYELGEEAVTRGESCRCGKNLPGICPGPRMCAHNTRTAHICSRCEDEFTNETGAAQSWDDEWTCADCVEDLAQMAINDAASEPPITLAEQHAIARRKKQELR